MLKLKVIFIILLFAFTVPVFSAYEDPYQVGAIEVVSGKTQTFRASDVTDAETDSITIMVTTSNTIDEVITPQVLISKQLDGFSCELEVMRRVGVQRAANDGKIEETYAFIFSWYPGNDWSSCTIEVLHPSLEKNSIVLYVEGDMRGPLGLSVQKNK